MMQGAEISILSNEVSHFICEFYQFAVLAAKDTVVTANQHNFQKLGRQTAYHFDDVNNLL